MSWKHPRITIVALFAAVVWAAPTAKGNLYFSGSGHIEVENDPSLSPSGGLPAILIALLIDGVLRGILPVFMLEELALYVVIFSIGISIWPQYARTVRASAFVENTKEYVQAAHLIGIHPVKVMMQHVLPNVMGPVLVIATIQIAIAIINEATLSFLGVGIPVTEPSLGTLLRIGNDFLFSGEWWITAFPGATLAILVVAINLLGDWMRDVFNPKLR